MQLCIFEDKNALNFEPFTYYRPVFDLVCGIHTLKEKILRHLPGIQYSLICSDYLEEIMRERNPGILINEFVEDDYIFINGSVLADNETFRSLPRSGKEEILFVNKDIVVAAKLSGKTVASMKKRGNLIPDTSLNPGIRIEQFDCKTVKYAFDLIKYNSIELAADFAAIKGKYKSSSQEKYLGVHLIEKDQIVLGESAVIKPGVVLDASGGPVYIGRNARIFPNAVIEGPVSIGDSTLIKSCSTIYSNVSIGKVCKVGGEVEDMIMLDYSNKQHAGFIGHSYLGSWVNLGADTNCSDLKNNYSPVRIKLSSGEVDTGMQFLGVLVGDHTKTAINTMFNTGTVAGFSSNIYGAGFPDKYIPSFSWGGSDEGFVEYDPEKSIKTAKIVTARRNVGFTASDEKLFKNIFELTRKERVNKEFVK